MKLNLLFKNSELIAKAPNIVAKLREVILQLAIQGKIVSQDSKDEPATIMLRESAGKLINRRKLPFKIPASWAIIKFSDFFDIKGGSQPPKSTFIGSHKKGYVRLLQIRDLGSNPIPVYVKKGSVTKFCSDKDVMMGRYGASVGKVFMGKEGAYNVALVKFIFNYENFFNLYVFYLLKSPYFQNHLFNITRSAQAGFNKGNLSSILIPTPPFEEQKRIAKKIDQLMALCDSLEDQKQRKDERHVILNDTFLDRLISTKNQKEIDKNLCRIKANFDLLYDNPKNVIKLRQAIIQLAVQGKLVSQNPKDEPASVLLKNIDADKEKLIKKKRIKNAQYFSEIRKNEVPYELPKGWVWSRFGLIAEIASNLVKPDKYPEMPHIAPNYIEKGNAKLLPYKTIREDKVISSNHLFYSGQILYSKIRPNLSKAVIVDFGGLCSADMYPINSFIDKWYLLYYMLSNTFLGMAVKKDTRVAMPKINQNELNQIIVPIPPLNEQKKIVKKVDELIYICDALNDKLYKFQQKCDELLFAIVNSNGLKTYG